jgi:hypothetical protein
MFDQMKERMFNDIYKSGHINRYCFEFDFLPNVLPSLYQKDEIDDYIMTHPSEWKKILVKKGVRSDWGFDKIKVEKFELDKDRIKFIFTFPEPKVSPECFFAMLIFDEDKNSNYFTLELDFGSSSIFKEGGGIVCGQKGMKHLNYSRRCRNDLNEFEKTVQDIINGKPNDPRDMFKNFDFEEAAKIGIDDEFFKKMGVTSEQMKEACTIY